MDGIAQTEEIKQVLISSNYYYVSISVQPLRKYLPERVDYDSTSGARVFPEEDHLIVPCTPILIAAAKPQRHKNCKQPHHCGPQPYALGQGKAEKKGTNRCIK